MSWTIMIYTDIVISFRGHRSSTAASHCPSRPMAFCRDGVASVKCEQTYIWSSFGQTPQEKETSQDHWRLTGTPRPVPLAGPHAGKTRRWSGPQMRRNDHQPALDSHRCTLSKVSARRYLTRQVLIVLSPFLNI